jgi:hypothetical protein
VYFWEKNKILSFGHAAMQLYDSESRKIPNGYISAWPLGNCLCPTAIEFRDKLAKDISAYSCDPDEVYEIKDIDVPLMLAKFREYNPLPNQQNISTISINTSPIKNEEKITDRLIPKPVFQIKTNWSLCGSGFFRTNEINCSGFVLHLLFEGNHRYSFLKGKINPCLHVSSLIYSLTKCCRKTGLKEDFIDIFHTLTRVEANAGSCRGWVHFIIGMYLFLYIIWNGYMLVEALKETHKAKNWINFSCCAGLGLVIFSLVYCCMKEWKSLAGVTPSDLSKAIDYLSNHTETSNIKVTKVPYNANEEISVISENNKNFQIKLPKVQQSKLLNPLHEKHPETSHDMKDEKIITYQNAFP